MKKYIAKTNVSINVVLASGTNRHIAFSALTGGGSVYYTEDPDIIQAIERHYKFGTLFRVDPKYDAEKPRPKPIPKPVTKSKSEDTTEQPTGTASAVEAPNPIPDETAEAEQPAAESEDDGDTEAESEDDDLKKIVVSDPDSAKAYLAEQFGYSRTKIKTLKAIKEAAAAHGIVFEGI